MDNLIAELKNRIAGGEHDQLDFKFRIDDQRKIARTLVAFANSKGGSLLIGVKDNGKIAGVDPEEEYYMCKGAADLYCNPPIAITTKVWKDDRHMVLEVLVALSNARCKALDEHGKWATYYRIQDNTVRGNKILDRYWVLSRTNHARPESFSESELKILQHLRENSPLSISKIYAASQLDKGRTDRFIAALMAWGIVHPVLSEEKLKYALSN